MPPPRRSTCVVTVWVHVSCASKASHPRPLRWGGGIGQAASSELTPEGGLASEGPASKGVLAPSPPDGGGGGGGCVGLDDGGKVEIWEEERGNRVGLPGLSAGVQGVQALVWLKLMRALGTCKGINLSFRQGIKNR